MKRVYVNEKWCLGCHLCEYYCAFANTGMKDMAKALCNLEIRPRIRIEEQDDISFAVSPSLRRSHVASRAALPVHFQRENGCHIIDSDKCVGCFTCILACPYGAISQSETGAIQKCELCAKTNDGIPQCVAGCPNGAIVFEDRG